MTHASDNPITVPPKTANPNPTSAARVNFSFNINGENNATQSGPVETNTTELATDVYSREEIHVAKWTARNIPDSPPRTNCFAVKFRISARWRVHATGASNNVANVSRKEAMTSDGAPSDCAKRIKIEAVETARMATNRLRGRRRRGCSSVIR